MNKITFNKSYKIIAAVLALVLCFSALLWIAPPMQAEELDIRDTAVTDFAASGARATLTNGNLAGGSIGVFVTSTTGGRYTADNVKWTYNNGEWEFDGDSKVLFENDDENQKIAAYYPYNETTNGSVAITLPEAYDANYDQYDYLYGEYAPLSSNPATITMHHLMSKVTVNVQSYGTEAVGESVKSIALVGVSRTATWTLPGDTLSEFGNGESIDLYGNGSSYDGYALPTGAETLTLRITMESGRVFVATTSLDDLTTLDKTEGLESGVHYRIGVKVGKDKVEISNVNVTPWQEREIEGGVATEVERQKFEVYQTYAPDPEIRTYVDGATVQHYGDALNNWYTVKLQGVESANWTVEIVEGLEEAIYDIYSDSIEFYECHSFGTAKITATVGEETYQLFIRVYDPKLYINDWKNYEGKNYVYTGAEHTLSLDGATDYEIVSDGHASGTFISGNTLYVDENETVTPVIKATTAYGEALFDTLILKGQNEKWVLVRENRWEVDTENSGYQLSGKNLLTAYYEGNKAFVKRNETDEYAESVYSPEREEWNDVYFDVYANTKQDGTGESIIWKDLMVAMIP